jgi:hypothetical protein
MQRRSFLKALVGIPAAVAASKVLASTGATADLLPVTDEFAGLDIPTEIKKNLEKSLSLDAECIKKEMYRQAGERAALVREMVVSDVIKNSKTASYGEVKLIRIGSEWPVKTRRT